MFRLFAILLALMCTAQARAQSPAPDAIPLRSLDEAGLALLGRYPDLTQKRVVFVGEPDHCIHEKYAYRLAVIRALVASGFRHVGMEMGYSDARRIDRYLKTGDESWLHRVALYGYQGDAAPGSEPRTFQALGFYKAYVDEELRFARALRALSLALPRGDRLHFFGYDVDVAPGGGYTDARDLLAPLLDVAGVRELAQQIERHPGEDREAELRRLSAALERIRLAPQPLRNALPYNELYATVAALGESLLVDLMMTRTRDDHPDDLLPVLTRREQAMFRQVDDELGRVPARQGIILLGHNDHLIRDEHALVEVPENPRWTWPRVGTHLVHELGDRVFAVWLLYGGGAHDDPASCTEGNCPIVAAPDDIGHTFGRAGSYAVIPTRANPALDSPVTLLANGQEIKARLARATDAVVFAQTVHPLSAATAKR